MPSLRGRLTESLESWEQVDAGLLDGHLQAPELREQPVSEDGEDDEGHAPDGQPDDQHDHGRDPTAPEF